MTGILVALVACNPGPPTTVTPPPTTGQVVVSALTTGSDSATAPYEFTLGAALRISVPTSGTATIDSVPAGTYSLPRLANLAPNCEQVTPDSVAGASTITVVAGQVLTQAYTVRCHAIVHNRIIWRSALIWGGAVETVEPDGTDLQDPPGGYIGGWSAISPDAARIAWADPQADDLELNWIDTHVGAVIHRGGGIRTLTWAPDGKHLVFEADNHEIHEIATDGTGDQLIAIGREPMLSPDGAQVAFVRLTDGMIHTAPPNGSDMARGPDIMVREAFPRWSPDGKHIAFLFDVAGSYPQNFQLFMMDANLDNPREVTFLPNTVGPPSWSPDGKTLTFNYFPGIWTVNADGTNPTLIYNEQVAVWGVEWTKVF